MKVFPSAAAGVAGGGPLSRLGDAAFASSRMHSKKYIKTVDALRYRMISRAMKHTLVCYTPL